MKFCKRYQQYMQGREKELPGVGLKRLKKILKRCRRECHSQGGALRQQPQQARVEETAGTLGEGCSSLVVSNRCPDHCPEYHPLPAGPWSRGGLMFAQTLCKTLVPDAIQIKVKAPSFTDGGESAIFIRPKEIQLSLRPCDGRLLLGVPMVGLPP